MADRLDVSPNGDLLQIVDADIEVARRQPRRYTSWAGAALVGGLASLEHWWITREQVEEHGVYNMLERRHF